MKRSIVAALTVIVMLLLYQSVQADLNNGLKDGLTTFLAFNGKDIDSLKSDSGISAEFKDQDGNPTKFPEENELVVGKTYQITTTYTSDGINDLTHCALYIQHPQSGHSIFLVYNVQNNKAFAQQGKSYVSPVTILKSKESNKLTLTWNFFLKSGWQLVQDGVNFFINAADQSNALAGWKSAGENLAYAAPEYGATIITHGFVIGGVPKWTMTMGKAIGKRLGNYSVSKLNPDTGLFEYHYSDLPLGAKYGLETIFIMNWAVESNDQYTQGFSEAAADAFLAALIRHQQTYRSTFFLDKLHFIAHSRGTVVTSELIERLTALSDTIKFESPHQNKKVGDKINVTYLDPHPVFNHGDAGKEVDRVNYPVHDFPGKKDQVIVWKGIDDEDNDYADNYYQSQSYFPQTLNLDGMPVYAAVNRDLDYTLGDDYIKQISHFEVHAWYFGTIDPEANKDELKTMSRRGKKAIF